MACNRRGDGSAFVDTSLAALPQDGPTASPSRLLFPRVDDSAFQDVDLTELSSHPTQQSQGRDSSMPSPTNGIMSAPTSETQGVADPMHASITSIDDEYDTIGRDEAIEDPVSPATIMASGDTEADLQSEAAMSGSTVSYMDESDADNMSESEYDAVASSGNLPEPSTAPFSQPEQISGPVSAAKNHTWSTQSPSSSKFIAGDMEESAFTVVAKDMHGDADVPGIDGERIEAESHADNDAPEVHTQPKKISSTPRQRSSRWSEQPDWQESNSLVVYLKHAWRWFAAGFGLHDNENDAIAPPLRWIGLIAVIGAILLGSLGQQSSRGATSVDDKLEMQTRLKDLQDVLKGSQIGAWNGDVIVPERVLKYRTVHKLGPDGVNIVDVEYYSPLTASVEVVAVDAFIMSLPKDRHGKYPSPPDHRSSIIVRTTDDALRSIVQAPLIPGLTYLRFDAQKLKNPYYVDVHDGERSETFKMTMSDAQRSYVHTINKAPSDHDGSANRSFNDKSASTSAWEDWAAVQEQLLAQTYRMVKDASSMLAKDFETARGHLSKNFDQANKRGKKALNAAGEALALNYEEALADLSEMGQTLYKSLAGVLRGAGRVVQEDVKPAVDTTREEVQRILKRAHRNSNGILGQVNGKLRSKLRKGKLPCGRAKHRKGRRGL